MIAACLMLAPFQPQRTRGNPLDFRPVLRNRTALGYIFGYGAHCFELYGMRTWLVSFWTFVAARNAGDVLIGPIALSVIVTCAVVAGEHSRQRGRAALRPSPRRQLDHDRFGAGRSCDRLQRTLSPLIVLLLSWLWLHGAGELRCADIRHELKAPCPPNVERRWRCIRLSASGSPLSAHGAWASRWTGAAARGARRAGSRLSLCLPRAFCLDRWPCGGHAGQHRLTERECLLWSGADRSSKEMFASENQAFELLAHSGFTPPSTRALPAAVTSTLTASAR